MLVAVPGTTVTGVPPDAAMRTYEQPAVVLSYQCS